MTKFNVEEITKVADSVSDALLDCAGGYSDLTQEEYEIAFIVAIKTWQRRFSGDSPLYKQWFNDIEASFERFIEEVNSNDEQ